MKEAMDHQYASASLACLDALPSTVPLDCSAGSGWRSLLVRRSRCMGAPDAHDTLTTPDYKLVVVLRGEVDVDVHKRGLWRRAIYRPGTSGLSMPGEADRLRLRLRARSPSFEKLHVFLPHAVVAEVAENLRRPGQRSRTATLMSATFNEQSLAHVARTLVAGMKHGAPNFVAEAAAYWLAVQLLTVRGQAWLSDGLGHGSKITDARLRRALDYMSHHMGGRLTLDAIAAEAAVSKFHFARLFRERLGVTPMKHLAELRVTSAAQMLRTTDLPIVRIAAECGYPNTAHFCAAFHRRFGLSPARYRMDS